MTIVWSIIIHDIYVNKNYKVKIHHNKDDNLNHNKNNDDDLCLILWLHVGIYFY